MLGVSAAPCFMVSTNLIHDPWTYKVLKLIANRYSAVAMQLDAALLIIELGSISVQQLNL